MAVLAAAIMFTISLVAVFGTIVSESRGVAVKWSRRPPKTSVTLIVFSVVTVGAVIGNGGRTPSTRPAPPGAASSSSQSSDGAVADYPGPSTDPPLPRLNLPVTYDYGPGPRHPVPPPGFGVAVDVGSRPGAGPDRARPVDNYGAVATGPVVSRTVAVAIKDAATASAHDPAASWASVQRSSFSQPYER